MDFMAFLLGNIAGVNGTDAFVMMEVLLTELKSMGFAGVQNFLIVGLIDGVFAPIWNRPVWAMAWRST